MITNEAGALHPHGNVLMLSFSATIKEHDILNDIQRIVQETQYHTEAELAGAIPQLYVNNFFTYLVRIFAAQSAIAPGTDTTVVVQIPKDDFKLNFQAKGFDERALKSAHDLDFLTQEELRKVDNIKMKCRVDLDGYTSPN